MQIEKGMIFKDKMTGNEIEVIEVTNITVRYIDHKTGFTYLLIKDTFRERMEGL